ncbi:hypothetical protein [Candidatus Leptofilum sp.]|uniref:hypothetical protein n=1 Tax=Candidatus Leptofilum sp. TaxID=3241576 RepID=UPI003B59ED1F
MSISMVATAVSYTAASGTRQTAVLYTNYSRSITFHAGKKSGEAGRLSTAQREDLSGARAYAQPWQPDAVRYKANGRFPSKLFPLHYIPCRQKKWRGETPCHSLP